MGDVTQRSFTLGHSAVRRPTRRSGAAGPMSPSGKLDRITRQNAAVFTHRIDMDELSCRTSTAIGRWRNASPYKPGRGFQFSAAKKPFSFHKHLDLYLSSSQSLTCFPPPNPLTSHATFKLERGRAHHSRGPNSFYPGQDTLHVWWCWLPVSP